MRPRADRRLAASAAYGDSRRVICSGDTQRHPFPPPPLTPHRRRTKMQSARGPRIYRGRVARPAHAGGPGRVVDGGGRRPDHALPEGVRSSSRVLNRRSGRAAARGAAAAVPVDADPAVGDGPEGRGGDQPEGQADARQVRRNVVRVLLSRRPAGPPRRVKEKRRWFGKLERPVPQGGLRAALSRGPKTLGWARGRTLQSGR